MGSKLIYTVDITSKWRGGIYLSHRWDDFYFSRVSYYSYESETATYVDYTKDSMLALATL